MEDKVDLRAAKDNIRLRRTEILRRLREELRAARQAGNNQTEIERRKGAIEAQIEAIENSRAEKAELRGFIQEHREEIEELRNMTFES